MFAPCIALGKGKISIYRANICQRIVNLTLPHPAAYISNAHGVSLLFAGLAGPSTAMKRRLNDAPRHQLVRFA